MVEATPTYAIRQPLLCASLPHRVYPIGKAHGLCVRCGALVTMAARPPHQIAWSLAPLRFTWGRPC